jgi:hypothetical protein
MLGGSTGIKMGEQVKLMENDGKMMGKLTWGQKVGKR